MPRLLLVEDEPRLGPLVADELGEQWTVTLCVDGEIRARTAAKEYFDVMVIDRRLPGIDGTTGGRRPFGSGASAPLCSCSTALGEVHDRVSGLDAGANDYLVKPFDFDESPHGSAPHPRLHRHWRHYRDRRVGIPPDEPQHHLPLHRPGSC